MAGAGKLNRPILLRLSEYLLVLERLLEKRHKTISSTKLASIFGNKASQVRQDISYINSVSNNFRQGYNIQELVSAIREALSLHKTKNVAIIGAGKLGQAIGQHVPFDSYGMNLSCLFDVEVEEKNLSSSQPLFHIDELEKTIEAKNISIVALCTPAVASQGIVNRLVNTSVTAILNYSRIRLQVPEKIVVRDQQMICCFMQLCYEVEKGLTEDK